MSKYKTSNAVEAIPAAFFAVSAVSALWPTAVAHRDRNAGVEMTNAVLGQAHPPREVPL